MLFFLGTNIHHHDRDPNKLENSSPSFFDFFFFFLPSFVSLSIFFSVFVSSDRTGWVRSRFLGAASMSSRVAIEALAWTGSWPVLLFVLASGLLAGEVEGWFRSFLEITTPISSSALEDVRLLVFSGWESAGSGGRSSWTRVCVWARMPRRNNPRAPC